MSTGMTHSGKVLLQLCIGKQRLNLSHLEPEVILVQELIEPIPPCKADLQIHIDDDIQVKSIFLPDGIQRAESPTRYKVLERA